MTVYQVVPTGAFSVTYDVLAGGARMARLEHRLLSLRDEATITASGRTCVARRERVMRASAVLEAGDGTTIATAERETFWRENYRVTFGDRELRLRQEILSWRGRFAVEGPDGATGAIELERWFTRRLVASFSAEAPPVEVVAFLAWIVLMVHRRQADS
jgi:uncharacterized protein YxjI